ncbi:MAG TPA: DUF2834 domain-containing protein [Mycobacterium sp.]|nr:DUF2834 domain-containing protein [Mycobacterium sp.]
MLKTDKILCCVYALLAAIALVTTWWNNIAYFGDENSGGLIGFVQAGYANYASTSLTNDLIVVATAAFVFMVVEARRLGVRHVWIYLVLSVVVALSVALPLFLIARQVKLAGSRSLDHIER